MHIFIIIDQFFCLFFSWPRHVACRILAPWPGIEAKSSAVKVPSPNHWTTREFPAVHILTQKQGP